MIRERLSIPAAVESAIDAPSIREVLPDGTYIAEPDNHFTVASSAVASLVARDLTRTWLEQDPGTENDADDQRAAGRKWSLKATAFLDDALYELSQVVAVIEAARPRPGFEPSFELKNGEDSEGARAASAADRTAATQSSEQSRTLGARLMAKKKLLSSAAAKLREKAVALTAWASKDDGLCDQLLQMRSKCGELRRDSNGRAAVDIGNGNWVAVIRKPFSVLVPPLVDLHFDVAHTEDAALEIFSENVHLIPYPDASNKKSQTENVISLIRLSRVSQFWSHVFQTLAAEIKGSRLFVEVSSSTAVSYCGPTHTLRATRRLLCQSEPSTTDSRSIEQMHVDDVLLVATTNLCLRNDPNGRLPRPTPPTKTPTGRAASGAVSTRGLLFGSPSSFSIVSHLTSTAARRLSLQQFENAVDRVVRRLRLLAEWTRDSSSERTRVLVSSTCADGDGPSRLLVTLVAGEVPGTIEVSPAFGIILPSLPENSTLSNRLDDVPGSYFCSSTGGEIESICALILSVRLLDSIEAVARTATQVLDVDRQGFSVLVNFPDDTSIRARVWADQQFERSKVTVWTDGTSTLFPTSEQGGRLKAWEALIRSKCR